MKVGQLQFVQAHSDAGDQPITARHMKRSLAVNKGNKTGNSGVFGATPGANNIPQTSAVENSSCKTVTYTTI